MTYPVLRFPGGKHPVRNFIADLFNPEVPYIEPYAGGASVGLEILRRGSSQVILNDLDNTVMALWRTIQSNPNALLELLPAKPTTSDFYQAHASLSTSNDDLVLAASKIIVQRCSMGGYGNGPIGGANQTGAYPVHARWNPINITASITEAHALLQPVTLLQQDALETLHQFPDHAAFIDPPYVMAGPGLYKNATDHEALKQYLNQRTTPYVLTIDQEDYVEHESHPFFIAGNRRHSNEWITNTHPAGVI